MRLKHRLTLALVLITSLALSGSFVTVALLVKRDEQADLDRALLAQAALTAIRAQQRDPQRPRVVDTLGEIPEHHAPVTRYAVVYDADGSVVSFTKTIEGAVPPLSSLPVPRELSPDGAVFDTTIKGVRHRAVVLPIAETTTRLFLALPRKAVDDDMRFLTEVFSLLFLAATVVTSLVARFVAERLSDEVDRITKVARTVADGNLSARVGSAGMSTRETRSLANDLDHMIDRLDALVAAQRTFVSHAAHELRSPLATLRGELQLARRRPRTADEYEATIDEALVEVDAITALTEDLLVLARLQGRAAGPADAVTTLGDALGDALRMARGPADARHVRFAEPPAKLLSVPIRGHRPDIARAIRNLVDNAVSHSPEGGLVTLTVSNSNERIELAVIDEGEGVPPGDAPNVFAPFFRGAKEQSEDKGTGLGLSIARATAKLSGGDVTLDEAHRPGARFVLSVIPVGEPEPPPPS